MQLLAVTYVLESKDKTIAFYSVLNPTFRTPLRKILDFPLNSLNSIAITAGIIIYVVHNT